MYLKYLPPLDNFLKHIIIIQKWYRKYKLPRTISGCHDTYKIWSNKYYIMRLILAYNDKETLLNYPEFCIQKLSCRRNYNRIFNKINENVNYLPSLNMRKPSDIREFINNTIFDTQVMKYIGY